MDDGEIIDENEIAAKEKAGTLSPAGAKSIRARIAQKDLKVSKDDQAIQLMLAHEHDFTADKEPDKTAQKMKDRAAALPPTLRAPVSEMIDNRLAAAKKAGVSAERPVQTEIYAQGKDFLRQGLFRPMIQEDVTEKIPHWFKADEVKVVGKTERQPIPDSQWEITASPNERAGAYLNYAKWQGKMRDFFKQYPDATPVEAQTYSQSILAPHAEAQAKAAITGPTDTVMVRSKDGRVGTIPAANLKKALDAGYTRVK